MFVLKDTPLMVYATSITLDNSHLSMHCTDINECSGEPCGGEVLCSNTEGSYSCMCDVGYAWNGMACEGMYFLYAVSSPCILHKS